MVAVVLSVFLAATAEPTTEIRPGLATTSAVVSLTLSNVAAAAAAWAGPAIQFGRMGQPDPWVTALSLGLGAMTQLMLAHFVVPETLRIGGVTDIERARDSAFHLAKWPALTGIASVVAFGIGAQLERVRFGDGQYLLLAGAIGAAVSWVVFDVLEVIGLNRGFR